MKRKRASSDSKIAATDTQAPVLSKRAFASNAGDNSDAKNELVRQIRLGEITTKEAMRKYSIPAKDLENWKRSGRYVILSLKVSLFVCFFIDFNSFYVVHRFLDVKVQLEAVLGVLLLSTKTCWTL
jgi:hypothetical protein